MTALLHRPRPRPALGLGAIGAMGAALLLALLLPGGCGILPDYREPVQSRPAARAASRPASPPASRPESRSFCWLQAAPDADGWTPVELSLARGAQLGDDSTDVGPLRLGLVSSQDRSVYGLDLNLGVGSTLAGGGGVAVALVANSTLRDFYGVQIAGLVNWQVWGWEREASLHGVQLSPLANVAASLQGVQIGAFNGAVRTRGLQLGVANMTSHMEGLSVAGLLSTAEGGYGVMIAPITFCSRDLTGVQFGLLNVVGNGVQVGLINFNAKGFLPVFPLFNF